MAPDDMAVQPATVIYTTKELLQRIDKRFDRLEDFASNAASRSDLVHLEQRVGVLEQDASGTKAVAEALLQDNKTRWSRREKLAGLFIAVVALAPQIVVIVTHFIH